MKHKEPHKPLSGKKDFVEEQIAQIERLIHDPIDQLLDLKYQRDLLTTIPGLGEITAGRLMAELGDVRRFDNVREIVAYVGLNPRQHQSGKKHAWYFKKDLLYGVKGKVETK